MVTPPLVDAPLTTPKPSLLRRTWPWLAGIAILAVVATRIPFDAFREAMTHGPHVTLAAVTLAFVFLILINDSISTWIGLVALRMRRPFRHVLAVRGATYVLFLLNYAVGQGGFGYYLHRSGTTALRAVGATLFLLGTNLATLLLLTSAMWLVKGSAAHTDLGWILLVGCIAFGVYLLVIVARPGFLANRDVLAPLFDGGLASYALAIVGRLPHTLVVVLGHWVALRAWGIPVPFDAGITVMPAVVIISVLPISPAGLGTSQAAFVYFFSEFAVGATADARSATVLGFGVVYFVYGLLATLAVGLACTPFAKRIAEAQAKMNEGTKQ